MPQHTLLLLCVKRRQELPYSMISLWGIVAAVNQNKFFTNTFTKKTLSFCKGPLSRLVKNKQGKTIPVYIWHQKDAHLAVSPAQPLQWAESWNTVKQKSLICKDRLGVSQWNIKRECTISLSCRIRKPGLVWGGQQGSLSVKFFETLIAVSFIKMKTSQEIN